MAIERNNVAGDFETMLKRHLARSSRQQTPCSEFDPEMASAYLESALSDTPRSNYESHLSGCSDCRRAVISLSRLSPQVAPRLAPPPLRSPLGQLLDWISGAGQSTNAPAGRFAMAGAATVLIAVGAVYSFRAISGRSTQENTVAMKSPTERPSGDVSAQMAASTPQPLATLAPSEAPDRNHVLANSRPGRPGQGGQGGGAAANAAAPVQMIAGRVSNNGGMAIAKAQVVLVDSVSQQTQAQTRTDAQGQFRLPPMPQGNYRLMVQAEGYATQQVADLKAVNPQDVQVRLDLGTSASMSSVEGRQALSEADRKSESAPVALAQADVQRRERAVPAPTPADASQDVADKAGRRLSPKEEPAKAAKPKNNTSNEDENFHLLLRKVRDKTFRFDRGIWVDQDYKPENRLPRTRLNHQSPEFEKVLADNPALNPFFDLGRVIVVWQGRVFEVRK